MIGGILGYLARPSIPLLGQLPFGAVITRASAYQGFASGYVQAVADRSLTMLVSGLAIGALLGHAIDHAMYTKVGGSHRTCPFCAETIRAQARICKHCDHTVEGA